MASMTIFSDRFTALEHRLDTRRSATDGGWPQKLGMVNAPTTIVATAQALEILRIRGLEHEDGEIQGGLRYLAKQVSEQTQPKSDSHPSGRGEWSRFPAYALWGLMRYPSSRHDPALKEGIMFSYRWLRAHCLPSGGWAEDREKGPLWLPGTMVAVHALDRFAIYNGERVSQESRGIADHAREHITAIAQRKNRSQLFWTQTIGGEACPGATSLAVLTLARGSKKHRDAARAGINWLAANRGEWTQRVHEDVNVETRRWRILSFSLGLRALMHPCGERDVNDPAVPEVVQHIDTLWNEEHQGWADLRGLEASTSGSYAVISAVHTLKRAWPFDPFEHLNVRAHRRAGHVNNSPHALRVLRISAAEQRIQLHDHAGTMIVETKVDGPSQWAILLALATRHHEAASNGSTDQTEMTISLEECARLCNGGKGAKPESVTRTLRRLHEKLATEAKTRSRRGFVDLIEDHVPPGTTERRLALEEIEVRFLDNLPAVSADAQT
jgi:hypothetical protein